MRYLLFLTVFQLCSFGELVSQTYSGTIHFGETNIDYEVRLKETEGQIQAFFTSIDLNDGFKNCLA